LYNALQGTGGNQNNQTVNMNNRCEIQVGILKKLAGANIARHTEKYKILYSPAPPYEVIETSALTEAELNCIKNFARFWELLINRNPFPPLLTSLLAANESSCEPTCESVFNKFMLLSGSLLSRFGRNWGIDRAELREALTKELEL
jgi:hypothetical protein